MAVRDAHQKPAFVYSNIYELYKKAKDASPITKDTRVFRAEDLANVPVQEFQPPKLTPVSKENAADMQPAAHAFDDLKANVHKLQDLHSRLRFMLRELEDLVGKK